MTSTALLEPRGLREGVRRCAPIAISVFAYGLVFGALAAQSGLSLSETALMSGVVFSGTVQFVVLGLWTMPLPVAAMLIATFLLSLRLVLMGATLRRALAGLSTGRALLVAWFVTDENWALTMSEAAKREDEAPARRATLGSFSSVPVYFFTAPGLPPGLPGISSAEWSAIQRDSASTSRFQRCSSHSRSGSADVTRTSLSGWRARVSRSWPSVCSAGRGTSSSAPSQGWASPRSATSDGVMRLELILIFAAMGGINYGIRAAGMLIGELLPTEGRMAAALAQLPAAILISLVAPLLLRGNWPEWAAAAVVAALASRTAGLLLPLVIGVVAVALLRLL